jgi:hypothetical protein
MIICNRMELRGCSDPRCGALHLVLSADGIDVAVACIPLTDIPNVIKDIQDATYDLITMRDQ